MLKNELENILNSFIRRAWGNERIKPKEFYYYFEKLQFIEDIPIYSVKQLEKNKNLIYMWAPAGNQNPNGQIIFSGFSTSKQAAKDIVSSLNNPELKKHKDFSSKLREICAQAVYKGAMLRRFAWGLQKIIPLLSNKIFIPIYDYILDEWSNFNDLVLDEENNIEQLNMGEGHLFSGATNCKVILTQSTLNGLAIKEGNNFCCSANKIPIKNAFKLANNYIPFLLKDFKNNKPKVIFVMGNKAIDCWNNYLKSIRLSNYQLLNYNWWEQKMNFIKGCSLYVIKIPHPSPGNTENRKHGYKETIKKIEYHLQNIK